MALTALLLVAGCGDAAGTASHDALLVAAAADLMPAFEELGERFEEETGERVVFNFGSSGRLAQQVIEGAPVDLFASADASFVDDVIAADRGDPETRSTYAFGRIVIWSRTDSWGGWTDLAELGEDEEVRVLAIANPEHAPYGRVAQEALEATGAWEAVDERLVFGDNVADAQRIAASGNADVAITALSLALRADERAGGRWELIPADLHRPLRQELVVTAGSPERAALATTFAAFVVSDEGREVMRRFGLLLPHEEPPVERGG